MILEQLCKERSEIMTGPSNMDIIKLAYEKIDERYSKAKYLDLECVMDTQTGYINATKFCSAASGGKKRFDNYLRSDRYKNLIAEYTKEGWSGIGPVVLVIQRTVNNELRGTYFNPDLLLDLASWVSPIVLIRTARFIKEWRLLSPENDIRFHKEIGEALKKGIMMNEYVLSETVIRDQVACDEDGIVEVETLAGFIDVLTNTKIIEVKTFCNWKHALGQVQAYGYYYPVKEQWIYLFDTPEDASRKEIIETVCNTKNVYVKYV